VGRPEFKKFFVQFTRAFPDIHVEVADILFRG